MKTHQFAELDAPARASLLARPVGDLSQLRPAMTAMLAEVAARGDAAVRAYTLEFDGIDPAGLCVTGEEFAAARPRVDPSLRRAIADAADGIRAFHRKQVPEDYTVETRPGVSCRLAWQPISTVGLYVPGGSAPLFSTVLMLGIPALLAGCRNIVLCTPPARDGAVPPEILCAAESLGLRTVVKAGGAQAVAAMALGTASVPKADKIFGPGNRYVTAMKSLVSQPPFNVAIDMLAGPTELLVIADDAAVPRWVAADLLSQAEHGADSQVVLVTPSATLARLVGAELERLLASTPRRAAAAAALENGYALLVRDLREAVEFSNAYAPEHLVIAAADAESIAASVTSAGSVFLGDRSSVVFGDYAAGTNHTLPTSGLARAAGGLTVGSFMKPIFFQTVKPAGAAALVPLVAAMARAERLEAHAAAALVRTEGR